jgi:hypothetical protein
MPGQEGARVRRIHRAPSDKTGGRNRSLGLLAGIPRGVLGPLCRNGSRPVLLGFPLTQALPSPLLALGGGHGLLANRWTVLHLPSFRDRIGSRNTSR